MKATATILYSPPFILSLPIRIIHSAASISIHRSTGLDTSTANLVQGLLNLTILPLLLLFLLWNHIRVIRVIMNVQSSIHIFLDLVRLSVSVQESVMMFVLYRCGR